MERVQFRLIKCPHCEHLLCWVNPRLPNYCPECGERIYRQLKFEIGHILLSDENARLTVPSAKPREAFPTPVRKTGAISE